MLKLIQAKAKAIKHAGIQSIASPIELIEDSKDFWYVSELGNGTLGKGIYHIKGIFVKSERIYEIVHLPLYASLIANHHENLKVLMSSLLNALDLVHSAGIVHADIKPENILVRLVENTLKNIKIIDFGSAFYFDKPSSVRMSTPEYLAPEILEYFNTTKFISDAHNSIGLCKLHKPWSFDMWSLGCIFLEILVGFPLWLSLKARVPCKGGYKFTKGLFATTGRDEKKIASMQINTVANLDSILLLYCPIQNTSANELLKLMLELNPVKRISPKDALMHKYFTEK